MTSATSSRQIIPVILSGGSGSRLWPMSRELYPKQLLSLCSERSMLQDTISRVTAAGRFGAPVVVCNQEHRFIIAEQLRSIGVAPDAIVLEPVGRNTAAACAVAALHTLSANSDALILVLPADHLILDNEAFLKAVDTAASAASDGYLVTFGITPTTPETGYGYIQQGSALPGHPGAFKVSAFIEKPPRTQAEEYLASGCYAWNSGMFLFPAAHLVEELERHAPAVLAAARGALEGGERDLDFFRLDAEAFSASPSISIDYALMEKTARAAVVPCSLGWTDVGVWPALWEVSEKDTDGNVRIGNVITEGAKNCYVRSESMLTAVVGLDDAVVVVTDDATLVAHKDHAQNVKAVVERLKQEGRREALSHRTVHRPWGTFQGVHSGERFQVKCLTVNPGARLSLQKHFHRAEHWVVVKGTAIVTRDTEQVTVYENQSIYIPMGTVHRLENPGRVPLQIIEVQSGSYLGEDDIVRIEDSYGRG